MIRYTVPELLSNGEHDEVSSLETVDVIFNDMGRIVNVYKSYPAASNLCSLDYDLFSPALGALCNHITTADHSACGLCDAVPNAIKIKKEPKTCFYWQSMWTIKWRTFQFWRIVKDQLALPLLNDLCTKTGLANKVPPCFKSLPSELKLKIVEFLPGFEIAKLGCVSSELKDLSTNNILWKRKYIEDFSRSKAEGVERKVIRKTD
ncbi:hypothetical protein IFM89_020675 [Coptis chinensis]|uniref:F-box domain-containing protein n=1 Tax=Coptis chinensis TaxID=261450 RepID=A0A835LE87_9MAGN|nr:hypothetical protein IFM89_020675 [Coptis chinensis]